MHSASSHFKTAVTEVSNTLNENSQVLSLSIVMQQVKKKKTDFSTLNEIQLQSQIEMFL